MHKQTSSGLMTRFTERFFSLWNARMLYYFHTEEEANAFFSVSGDDSATAQIQIDLTTVGSVRVCGKRNLPGGGRGIELHTPSRVWLFVPRSENEFSQWLSALSHIVTYNVDRLAQLTGDDELTRDVRSIEVAKLSPQTLSLLEEGAAPGEAMYSGDVVGERAFVDGASSSSSGGRGGGGGGGGGGGEPRGPPAP